jgi:hypothetical protein
MWAGQGIEKKLTLIIKVQFILQNQANKKKTVTIDYYSRTSVIWKSGNDHFSLINRKFEISRVCIIEVTVNEIWIMEAELIYHKCYF